MAKNSTLSNLSVSSNLSDNENEIKTTPVYVQGQPDNTIRLYNQGLKTYDDFMDILEENGIENINEETTMDLQLRYMGKTNPKAKSVYILNKTQLVDKSKYVITYFPSDLPHSKYIDYMSVMAYAIGQECAKPCYVIASKSCPIWQTDFIHHPLIKGFDDIEEFIGYYHS